MLLLVVLVVLVWLSRRFSPQIYDMVICSMTSVWYGHVLGRLDPGSRVLDVGIGTGTSLCRNASMVREKKLSVTGIDIDAAYVRHCEVALQQAGLAPPSRVVCKSVFDADLAAVVGSGFDAVYFSGSIALMPQPHVALQAAARLLRPGGVVFVTQTFQRQAVPLLSVVKPLLKYLTTIDFGRLTFEREVDDIVARSGLELLEKSTIPGSIDNAVQGAFILVLRPR